MSNLQSVCVCVCSLFNLRVWRNGKTRNFELYWLLRDWLSTFLNNNIMVVGCECEHWHCSECFSFSRSLSLPLLPIIQFHNMKWHNKSSQNLLVRYTKERALPITLHLPIHKSNVCSKLCHIVFAQFCLPDKWQWTETPNKLKYWEIEFKMFGKIRQASTSDQHAFGMEGHKEYGSSSSV